MTTTRTFVITTIWGDSATTTSTLHRHTKIHNPTESCPFYLLPQDVLTEIDLLASLLEHRDKLKAVITKIHPLLDSIIFAIPQYLWAPYHNFVFYRSWYNECCYTWAHRRVPTDTRSHYQNILASYYTVIKKLTQRRLDFTTSVAACQHITWDENLSAPYFKQEILDSYHDTQ